MKTPKKAWKDIARKLKNRKGTITAKGADIEESKAILADVEEIKIDVEEQEEVINVDKATETDTKLYEDINQDGEDLNIYQPTCESNEKAKNSSIETTAQEPNTPDIPLPTEPCSGSGKENSADEKSSKRSFQPVVAGVVGAILLVSSIASYIMKMHVMAVIGGIVGLICVSFALYNVLKPNTKLEKTESVEHYKSPSDPTWNGMLKNHKHQVNVKFPQKNLQITNLMFKSNATFR